MLVISILFLCIAHSISSQSCSVTPTGPCIGTTCPTANTCLTNLAQPICCPDANIVPATTTTTTITPTTTTVPVTNCLDLLNPSTGVSDCPSTAYLCNNGVYYTLMTQQCPRTCGRCIGVATTTTTSIICVDLLNPSTGVSDCPSRAYLCNNSVYYTLMTQQCPRTCSRCTGSTGTTTTTNTNCLDLVNPSTGVSDCPSRSSLCNNGVYYTLMTQQCPRTCGRCPSGK